MRPEEMKGPPLPAIVLRQFGKGRVAYFAAAVDAALWSYALPLSKASAGAGGSGPRIRQAAISVAAPMCVQATYWIQVEKNVRRIVVHLFNGVNTAADHGLPSSEVPLRGNHTDPRHRECVFIKTRRNGSAANRAAKR